MVNNILRVTLDISLRGLFGHKQYQELNNKFILVPVILCCLRASIPQVMSLLKEKDQSRGLIGH